MPLGPGAKPNPEDAKPTPEPEVEIEEKPKRFVKKADEDG